MATRRNEYPSLEIPERTERAWAAGFFDGEGCLIFHRQIKKRKRGPNIEYLHPMMSLNQVKDGKFHLERFKKAVMGMGYVRPVKGSKHVPKGQWVWTCGAFEQIQTCVGVLWPYLGITKKEQIKKVLTEYKEHFNSRVTLRKSTLRKLPQKELEPNYGCT